MVKVLAKQTRGLRFDSHVGYLFPSVSLLLKTSVKNQTMHYDFASHADEFDISIRPQVDYDVTAI